MTPATAAITDALPVAKQGVGSATNDLARELGGRARDRRPGQPAPVERTAVDLHLDGFRSLRPTGPLVRRPRRALGPSVAGRAGRLHRRHAGGVPVRRGHRGRHRRHRRRTDAGFGVGRAPGRGGTRDGAEVGLGVDSPACRHPRPGVEEVGDAVRPIIQSKLEAPVPRSAISRRELLEFCAGSPRKLTLIRAPAGWGKSTLLADWHELESETRPFAWVALDGGDSDPVRFLDLPHPCASHARPERRRGLSLLAPGPAGQRRRRRTPALFNELTALPHRVVLVLDDYHLVGNPEIDEGLSSFLEHLPQTFELVLSSRSEPALPLARSAPAASWPRSTHNSFASPRRRPTSSSTTCTGSGSTARTSSGYRELTEGLGGRSLPGDARHPRPSSAARVHRGIRGRRPPRRRLPEPEVLCGPVRGDEEASCSRPRSSSACAPPSATPCTDRPGSVRMLHELERSNFFLIPLDTKREWYCYHHLFGSFCDTSSRFDDPEHAHTLHRRASAWHRENGDPSEAIHHATAASGISTMPPS